MTKQIRVFHAGAAIVSSALQLIFLSAILILPAHASAAASSPFPTLTVEYSADRKIETDSGDMQGRVNAAPGMERNETQMQGFSSVVILRTDKKIGWMLMPAQKMYQELDLAKAGKQAGAVTPEQTVLELVGQETISGHAANKYKFVTKDKSAGGFLWYTSTGIPVKMDALSKAGREKTRMTVTLENIKIDPQDRSLFEVPAGFNRMPGGGGMFGAMGGGLKDAFTRPVKSQAAATSQDIATADTQVNAAVEAEVTEEVREVGAKHTVRGALRKVGKLFN
jgi:hypothetical protein